MLCSAGCTPLRRLGSGKKKEGEEDDVESQSMQTTLSTAGPFFQMNQDVFHTLLDGKEEMLKNSKIYALVDVYFYNIMYVNDFCTAVEMSIQNFRVYIKKREKNQSKKKFDERFEFIVQCLLINLNKEEAEVMERAREGHKNELKSLTEFTASIKPFCKQFCEVLEWVLKQQQPILKMLLDKKVELEKKIKAMEEQRKLMIVIYVLAFAGLLACSLLTGLLASKPVVSALSAASSIPLGSIATWFNSRWKKRQEALKADKELIDMMHECINVVTDGLDKIKIEARNSENILRSLPGDDAEFTPQDEQAINTIWDAMEESVKQAHHCTSNIKKASTSVLQKIIKYTY